MPTDIEDLPSQQAEQENYWSYPMPISGVRYAMEVAASATAIDVLAVEAFKHTAHYSTEELALIWLPCAVVMGIFTPYFIRARKKATIASEIVFNAIIGTACSGAIGLPMQEYLERTAQKMQAEQQQEFKVTEKDIVAGPESALWQTPALEPGR